jgi:hypothetical protein
MAFVLAGQLTTHTDAAEVHIWTLQAMIPVTGHESPVRESKITKASVAFGAIAVES